MNRHISENDIGLFILTGKWTDLTFYNTDLHSFSCIQVSNGASDHLDWSKFGSYFLEHMVILYIVYTYS